MGRRFVDAASETEREDLRAELAEHVATLEPALDGDVHPEVVALMASGPLETDPDAYLARGRDLGRLMGPLPSTETDAEPTWFEQRYDASIGAVRDVRERVEIGWASFSRFALGAAGLLSYLNGHGCADVRVTLSDVDDVRGD